MLTPSGHWQSSFKQISFAHRFVGSFILMMTMLGCASGPAVSVATEQAQASTTAKAQQVKDLPLAAPTKPAPVAASSLAIDSAQTGYCLDELLSNYGVRDVTLLVEDLADPGWRVGVGNRQLLVAVLAEITQRSNAIRLIVSGQDWENTARLIAEVAKREPFGTVPQYALRGTLFRQDTDRAIGVDMSLLATDEMQVVPRATSRTIVRLMPGQRAEVRRHGQTFSVNGTDEAQAVRQLVLLASIELIGRLARVPYWQCLGLNDGIESIQLERQDWYDRLAKEPEQLIRYFQQQLRLRGVYTGALDGTVSDAFKLAVSAYRSRLDLSPEPELSLEFFDAYLSARHEQVETVALATSPVPTGPVNAQTPPASQIENLATPSPTPTPTPAQAKPSSPFLPARTRVSDSAQATANTSGGEFTQALAIDLSLKLVPASPVDQLVAGQPVSFTVQPSRTAHVYCFLRDENHQIMRFFPSRFQFDSRVTPGGVALPGAVPFQIQINRIGTPEMITCFATESDVLPRLPGGLNSGDLTPLPASSLTQLRDAFSAASGGRLAQQTLLLRAN